MSLASHLGDIHDKAVELQTLFAKSPDLQNAELDECLSLTPKKSAFSGQLGKEPVVFLQYTAEDRHQIILAQRDELQFMAAYMGAGPYQLCRPLVMVPEAGLAVLSFLPGKTLAKLLPNASNRERTDWLQKSGEFLQTYCDPRRGQKPFAAGYWVKRLTDEISRQPDYTTQVVAKDMLENLTQRAQGLVSAQVTHAATHGNFTVANLKTHDGVLYGLAVDRETRMPIAQDIANFLCRLQQDNPRSEPRHRHGVSASDYKAFLTCGLISENESETVLAFLIGLKFTRLWMEATAGSNARMHLKQAIDRYLADPVRA